jgi:hypothetical protein
LLEAFIYILGSEEGASKSCCRIFGAPIGKRSLEMSSTPFCWCHCRKYLPNIIKEAVREENNKQNDRRHRTQIAN